MLYVYIPKLEQPNNLLVHLLINSIFDHVQEVIFR